MKKQKQAKESNEGEMRRDQHSFVLKNEGHSPSDE